VHSSKQASKQASSVSGRSKQASKHRTPYQASKRVDLKHGACLLVDSTGGLSPSVTRKLFNATVAPVVDYASSVWTHARNASAERALKRVQRVGGQAVVGCFQTVGTGVAEAEADLPTIGERHSRKALRMWVDLHSIPSTHPLALVVRRPTCKRYTSPL